MEPPIQGKSRETPTAIRYDTFDIFLPLYSCNYSIQFNSSESYQ